MTDARQTRCRHHIIISRPIGDVKTVFNVAVTAHHPRNDLLQAGAVTASGILLRLGQQGETPSRLEPISLSARKGTRATWPANGWSGLVQRKRPVGVASPTMLIDKSLLTLSKATLTYLALQSVGFDVECKRVRVFEEPPNMAEVKERQKTVRAYVVPDRRMWQEMVSRYYYDEPTGAPSLRVERSGALCTPNLEPIPECRVRNTVHQADRMISFEQTIDTARYALIDSSQLSVLEEGRWTSVLPQSNCKSGVQPGR